MDMEIDYRVSVTGPHVGAGGCGKTLCFDYLGEIEQHFQWTGHCDAETYPTTGVTCDGTCPVTITIERRTLDMSKPKGQRLVRMELLAQTSHDLLDLLVAADADEMESARV